ncbi:MAG: glutamine-hydrolyzing carbamoyl-phosphate synthase small subunit [Alphaproteobacteria bacterium]|nr:glutamine-hydrolyzing carbamoyl-phosphate synthase small subunit [Alphaproteobacteria bacterium]
MGSILLLEDGRSFEGEAFGARGTRVGEVVFNTAMTGYQEVLTDPSYREQIVVMTTSHVGNYGVNAEDPESDRVWVSGFVARSFSRFHANHRATSGLGHYLRSEGVPALHGIDTRALVRHIRDKGAMKGVISTDGTPARELWAKLEAWPGMEGRALAQEVCTPEPYVYADPATPRARVTVVDGGVKRNILRLLEQAGCRVEVQPITNSAEQWLDGADLLFLSNGPGDPAALPEVVEQLRRAVGRKPMVGICLGHQLLGLALGASTYKLPFGHRGANHPVRDNETGRVEVTSQNHGFCVDPDGITAVGGVVTHVNLNDQTCAGFRHDEKRVMAVQFHPEACPGPHDSRHLVIERFLAFAGVQ